MTLMNIQYWKRNFQNEGLLLGSELNGNESGFLHKLAVCSEYICRTDALELADEIEPHPADYKKYRPFQAFRSRKPV